jgi:hypothetical protein
VDHLPLDYGDLDWDGYTESEKTPLDLARINRKLGFLVDMGAYEAPLSGSSQ